MPLTTDKFTIPDSERTPCEIWDRVMGYFRRRKDFNIGKKQESIERHRYKESSFEFLRNEKS